MYAIRSYYVTESYTKEAVPKIEYEKCVYCFYCHDFCPVFALFNEVSPIHPRHVGEDLVKVDLTKLLEKPVEIPEEQLRKIAKILSINMSGIVNREKKANTNVKGV